jgi:hypothetical protein
MFVVVVLLTVMSRIYELRVLELKDLTSAYDMIEFLQVKMDPSLALKSPFLLRFHLSASSDSLLSFLYDACLVSSMIKLLKSRRPPRRSEPDLTR